MFAKEGLVTVALAWISVSIFGAIPFVISGDIPHYVDAFFETVSGFTTTGASIVNDVTLLSRGALIWRAFAHWIGGMGVLVFVLAISSKSSDRTMHILRAEMPGPIIDKFVPKARTTSIILYIIYTVMTLVLTILLLCGGMPLFDSLFHAFGTAGTGGFGMYSDGLASASPYIQWVITIFMFLFGINFNLYFLILIGKLGSFFKSRELWVYLGLALGAMVIITLDIYDDFASIADAIRTSAFQVSSIMTTTGFATADFNTWPTLSKSVLLFLMFTGACAGSTAGGFKVSRVIILFKKICNDLKKVVHPRTATVVKFEGKRLDNDTLNGVTNYFSIYVVIFIVVFLLLSLDSTINPALSIETNFASTMACFNNIGPGLSLTGPMANYDCYSYFSKIILSIAMLLGRLEIYPLLLTLNITTWLKR
jgi:trk system potassium uptake protein TrkH